MRECCDGCGVEESSGANAPNGSKRVTASDEASAPTERSRTDPCRVDDPVELDASDPLAQTLPRSVAASVAELLECDPEALETVRSFVDAFETHHGDWLPVGFDLLCVDSRGPHHAVVGEEEYRLLCVLDAFGLAHLCGDTVVVTSAVPGGGELTLQITEHAVEVLDGVSDGVDEQRGDTRPENDGVAPAGGEPVLSFGAAASPDVESPVAPEDVYRSGCPYLHAFPDRERYERWAARSDGETIALPLSAGVPLARAIFQAGTATERSSGSEGRS